MDAGKIIGIVAPILNTGPVSSGISALNEGLKLINYFCKDNPEKQVKHTREYLISLLNIAKEVRNAQTGADVSDLVAAYIELMDNK